MSPTVPFTMATMAVPIGEQVQDRRVPVGDADRVLGGGVTDVVGGAVDCAPLDAAARHPDAETTRSMVTASVLHIASGRKLGDGQAPEFTSPQNQGAVEKP